MTVAPVDIARIFREEHGRAVAVLIRVRAFGKRRSASNPITGSSR